MLTGPYCTQDMVDYDWSKRGIWSTKGDPKAGLIQPYGVQPLDHIDSELGEFGRPSELSGPHTELSRPGLGPSRPRRPGTVRSLEPPPWTAGRVESHDRAHGPKTDS